MFPNPNSPCQVCANSLNTPSQCTTAYKGVPGQFCFKFLNAGIAQACCCPSTAKCAVQTANVNTCQCDSGATPAPKYVVVKRTISIWVWVGIALFAVCLGILIYWCCCRNVDVVEPMYVEPVYVQPGYGQPGYGQPGYVQQGYVQGGPGYGYGGGYGGGDVAAGVAVGAAVGVVGGVALGAAMAGGGGYYGGGGYAAGGAVADPNAGGGFSGGGDFAGDF
ncbi:hypothetical protein DYB37_003524 [Aphanomyces astaci]|nr:hypothetical protein DYB36_004828 [Aphanomyces astaci]RHY13141.1 hypothetical protein DYB25_014306 [Aphanomyces astaci]RHY41761.1 hypothetical protein DYB34_013311 [Aphanomyces astaci]RHY63332.1 hypothetical protein DYB30_010497 [Aphanomyces astaci]RHY75149.1 hypothetical protein DYB38_013540 [Aphanomyces astaci]